MTPQSSPSRRPLVWPLCALLPFLAILLPVVVLATAPALAQSAPAIAPEGGTFLLHPSDGGDQTGPRVTALVRDGFGVAWTETDPDRIFVLRLDEDGDEIFPATPLLDRPSDLTTPRVTSIAAHEILVALLEEDDARPCPQFEAVDDGGPEDRSPSDLEFCGGERPPLTDLAIDGRPALQEAGFDQGGATVAWTRQGPVEQGGGVYLVQIDPTGQRLDTVGTRIAEVPDAIQVTVARDTHGRSLVAWRRAGDPSRIHTRVLPRDQSRQEPLAGVERIVTVPTVGSALDAVALDGPGSGFVLAFLTPGPDPSRDLPLAVRLSPDGTQVAPPINLGVGILTRGMPDAELGPALAAGPSGRFGVVWVSPDHVPGTQVDHVFLRVYAFDGTPLELRSRVVPTTDPADPTDPTQGDDLELRSPDLAWSVRDNGLLAVWQESRPDALGAEARPRVKARLYRAREPRGRDELCIFRGNTLSCASQAERPDPATLGAVFGVGIASGDQPLLTDFDGDGRDDLCIRRRTPFRCDTAHDGFLAEDGTQSFGGRQGTPVGANVNGDPFGEICLRAEDRSNRFLCDTARNGFRAERFLAFGPRDSEPFLGDADGDGRDELCLVIEDTLRCDTAQNGGGAELILPLPQQIAASVRSGGIPFLVDLDGDGVDRLCLTRVDNWLCDMGGGVSSTISMPTGPIQPGDVVLAGDLDGL